MVHTWMNFFFEARNYYCAGGCNSGISILYEILLVLSFTCDLLRSFVAIETEELFVAMLALCGLILNDIKFVF